MKYAIYSFYIWCIMNKGPQDEQSPIANRVVLRALFMYRHASHHASVVLVGSEPSIPIRSDMVAE